MKRCKRFGVLVCLGLFLSAFLPASDQGAQTAQPLLPPSGDARIGVYLTSNALTKPDILDGVLDACRAGTLNTMVINVKNMHGEITYASEIPFARTIGAVTDRLDLDEILPQLRAEGIYLIARQVLFYDPVFAAYRGCDHAWVPVHDELAMAYNLAIAEEVANLGFDEIQFDYIRYADEGEYVASYEDRYAAVDRFLAEAVRRLSGRVALSADVFGRVLWPWNLKRIDPIGQSLEEMSSHLDFISPMLYPSHYAEQTYRDDPYKTVRDALTAGAGRVDTQFRPFLQAFDQALPPGMSLETYIQEQIRAARESGANGVLFWHPACDYRALYRALE
jgi:hypothetical protein